MWRCPSLPPRMPDGSICGLSNRLVTLGGMGQGSTALKRVDSVRNHFSSSLPLAPFKLKLAT